jgi:catechol 2,3-dioxygenase-like lactoylglutathione lyase family enzyme
VDMKIEVVVLPVSDVDRAKQFYKALGWREDADVVVDGGVRIVQVTPPGSPCSVQFGTGLTPAAPGSLQGAYLVVSDIEAARAELLEHGAQVSETYHEASAGARFQPVGGAGRLPGPDPADGTYRSFASFTDPDGNGWLLQEITTRLPGRD